MNNREYWLGLQLIPGLGPITYQNLLRRFKKPENILNAKEYELAEVDNVGPKLVQKIKDFDFVNMVDKELVGMAKKGIDYITIQDLEYPKILKQIPDAPFVLFKKGKWTPSDDFSISIVGSRKSSTYGKSVAHRLAYDLAKLNITIISGMARGIDTVAHRAALLAGGRTIAVLGCGQDVIYPPENRKLMSQIEENGLIFSEFPLGTKPLKQNFPMRNRIIAGLSLGAVIIEAAENSGALITAYQALDQGKEIFAVPGNITSPTSKGTNFLIKQGAKLVENVDDIIYELRPKLEPLFDLMKEKGNDTNISDESEENIFSDEEKAVLKFLSPEPQHIDTLLMKSEVTVNQMASILLQLEINGVIKQLPGKMFIKL